LAVSVEPIAEHIGQLVAFDEMMNRNHEFAADVEGRCWARQIPARGVAERACDPPGTR
jgi:hypothetical protein